MPTRTVNIPLAESDVGLDLEIQFIDTAGADVGVPITAGFVEIGKGAYEWTGVIPNTRGVGVFRDLGGDMDDLRATIAVNPEEFTGLAGGGNNTVNFVIADENDNPVVGAIVTIRQDGTIVAWGPTVAGGLISFALSVDDYTYSVNAGSGFVSQVDIPLSVTTDPQAVPVELETQSPTPPIVAGLCTVEFLVTLNGRPQAGYRLSARLVNLNSSAADELLSAQIDEGETDNDGRGELQLVQEGRFDHGNGVYEIIVETPLPNRVVTHRLQTVIPDEDSVAFKDLLP